MSAIGSRVLRYVKRVWAMWPVWAVAGLVVFCSLLWGAFVVWSSGLRVISGGTASVLVGEDDGANVLQFLAHLGDSYGVLNAVFSGLALGAIALTIYFDSRARRESLKPLVIASIDSEEGVVLLRPETDGISARVVLRILISIKNATTDAALDAVAKVSLSTEAGTELAEGEFGLDHPLVHNQSAPGEVRLALTGASVGIALGELTSNKALVVSVATSYKSLEVVSWATSVDHTLSCADEYYGPMNRVRAGRELSESDWHKDREIPLACSVKRGTWRHSRA